MSLGSLKLLADAVNPALCVLFAAAAWRRGRSRGNTADFVARSACALLLTFILAHLNRWAHLSTVYPTFPSGHMTFFASLATSLFLIEYRSVFLTIPCGLLYGLLIVVLSYHPWIDLAGAALFSVPVTIVCHTLFSGRGGSSPEQRGEEPRQRRREDEP